MKKINLTAIILLFTIQAFSQTYLVQVKPKGSAEWGYANEKGEMIIPARFGNSLPFSEDGFAPIYDPAIGRYYFINTKGEKLKTAVTYCNLHNNMGYGVEGFSNGLAAVKVNGKWGYLNKSGKMAIYPKYKEANKFSGGFSTVKRDGKYFIIDTLSNESEIHENVQQIKKFQCGKAPFENKDGLMGFINTKGEVVVLPKYKSVGYFVKDIAWVKNKESEVGFINSAGEEIIRPQFSLVNNFDEENMFARVKNDIEWFYVSNTGEIFNAGIDITSLGNFSNGLAKAEKKGKFGFINTSGKWAIEPQFEGSRDFKNGFAAVKINGFWGLINTKGEIVAEPKFGGIKDVELIK